MSSCFFVVSSLVLVFLRGFFACPRVSSWFLRLLPGLVFAVSVWVLCVSSWFSSCSRGFACVASWFSSRFSCVASWFSLSRRAFSLCLVSSSFRWFSVALLRGFPCASCCSCLFVFSCRLFVSSLLSRVFVCFSWSLQLRCMLRWCCASHHGTVLTSDIWIVQVSLHLARADIWLFGPVQRIATLVLS